MMKKLDYRIAGVLVLLASIVLVGVSAKHFLKMRTPDILYPGKGVTRKGRLSDYLPNLANSPGDTDIYFIKGAKSGGKFLVLGGTHNDEVAGVIAAITLLENAIVTQGELIVIPRANNSGATYIQEMIGMPEYIELQTPGGFRAIRTGSRYANPAFQFPDPDVYKNLGGADYPGTESRNLNRVYPGKSDGLLAEREAQALIRLIKDEGIDIVLDLHEAVPEHYVVNCMVGHNRAMDLVAMTIMSLQMQGIDIKMYESPKVYGFSHRDIGDNTDAFVVLAESTDILQGAFRGKPTQDLIHTGKDSFYDILAKNGKNYVDYTSERGVSLSERVGRHIATVMELSRNLSYVQPEKSMEITNLPEYKECLEKGIEAYLQPK